MIEGTEYVKILVFHEAYHYERSQTEPQLTLAFNIL